MKTTHAPSGYAEATVDTGGRCPLCAGAIDTRRAERAEAERDALAAQVARVEALGEEWLAMDEANADYFSRERLDPTLAVRVATVRQEQLQAALAGSEADRGAEEAGHKCEPYYSRAECGQCGWQEQWCATCSRQMCGCATGATDQDAMGADQ